MDRHAFTFLADRASGSIDTFSRSLGRLIPNPRSILQIPLFSRPIIDQTPLQRSGQGASCPNTQLSCHNTTAVPNTCCFNYPGGQILQTQFWDTDPAVGPVDSWTIHGLWPDHCDGSFDQYCDSHRLYNNVSEILEYFNEMALLSYMKIYWKDYQGSDPTLWSHEWNKHGTCVSTLETSCYVDYVSQEEIVDYFEKTVELFKGLPTYYTLSDAGIVPDKSKTYTSDEIQSALEAMHGAPVTIRCRNGQFDEVWYHFDVRGSAQTGQWEPSAPDGAKSNCPSRGIKYVPKDMSSTPTPTSKTTTSASRTDVPSATSTTPPRKAFTGAGFLEVLVNNETQGCLIGDGSWYTSGTCATYHAEDDVQELTDGDDDDDDEHLFTLTTRKGPCGFLNGIFTCGRNVGKQDIFSAGDGGLLALKKNTQFFADKAPGHAQRAKV